MVKDISNYVVLLVVPSDFHADGTQNYLHHTCTCTPKFLRDLCTHHCLMNRSSGGTCHVSTTSSFKSFCSGWGHKFNPVLKHSEVGGCTSLKINSKKQ